MEKEGQGGTRRGKGGCPHYVPGMPERNGGKKKKAVTGGGILGREANRRRGGKNLPLAGNGGKGEEN